MHRWERSHGRVGVAAPSWLTFEVHRPYFDGGPSPLTAIQARGPLVAERLFAARQPLAPRFGMVMPASFRQLLVEESRLTGYRARRPIDLPDDLATPAWRSVARAFDRQDDLDATDRAGLALWAVAACLPDAVLDLAPEDLAPERCHEVLPALVQQARATALFQRDGLGPATRAAFAALVDRPVLTVAHLQACAAWSYLLARHAPDWSAAEDHGKAAARIADELAPDLPAFDRGIWQARLLLRQAMVAERAEDLGGAWELLEQARLAAGEGRPATPEQEEVATEMGRRILDRRVEIAVKRGDGEAEACSIDEGLKLDPWCVKVRMQAAQAAERRGDLPAALAGYLVAARLGPYGTAFALLRAASCAGRLGHDELGRVLTERAFRAAPRSAQTRAALVQVCEATGDRPLADVLRAEDDRESWHHRMYGAYLDLSPSQSPCLFAGIPNNAYRFAVEGESPRIDVQRILAPAFRANLVRESGLLELAARHPADVPPARRTPEWEQLCEWVADFDRSDLSRQYLTCLLLFRLGFRDLVLELLPYRPVAELREPLEFYVWQWRDVTRYVASVGSRNPQPPTDTFAIAEAPGCPLHLRLAVATFGIVFAARETKSAGDADHWRARAEEHLREVLGSDEFTPFETTMLESRFYRGAGFTPFLHGDHEAMVADMDRAEELARAVPATTPWEEFLKRENLHACLESRSKEAFAMGDLELGHARTEEFLALDPYDPKSHIELAESLARQQRFAEAGDSYLRAARLGPPGTAIAWAMAGECHDRAGNATLAEDCFVQALRVDPYAVSAARGWRRVAGDGTRRVAADGTRRVAADGTGPVAADGTRPVAAEEIAGLASAYAGSLEEWGAARQAGR